MKPIYHKAKHLYLTGHYSLAKLLISQNNSSNPQQRYQLVGRVGDVVSIVDTQTRTTHPVKIGDSIPGTTHKVQEEGGKIILVVDDQRVPLAQFKGQLEDNEWSTTEKEVGQLIATLLKLDQEIEKHTPTIRSIVNYLKRPYELTSDLEGSFDKELGNFPQLESYNLQRRTILNKLTKMLGESPQLNLQTLGLSYDPEEGMRRVENLAKSMSWIEKSL